MTVDAGVDTRDRPLGSSQLPEQVRYTWPGRRRDRQGRVHRVLLYAQRDHQGRRLLRTRAANAERLSLLITMTTTAAASFIRSEK